MRWKSIGSLMIIAAGTIGSGEPQHSGIEGYVSVNISSPVAGAAVGIDSSIKGVHRRTVTPSSGYFLLDDLQPGAYSVWAEVKGIGCIIYPNVPVFDGQRVRRDFNFVRSTHQPDNCEPVAEKTK